MDARLTAFAVFALVLPVAGCFGPADVRGSLQDEPDAAKTCKNGYLRQNNHYLPCDLSCPVKNETLDGQPCPGTDPVVPEPVVSQVPWFPSDGASEMITLELPSFDEHQIPLTIYRPLVADATQQVPALLHSHGFTGKRASTEDAFKDHVAAGFAVVSFDERGHGDSMDDSEVYFMHPDQEVQDVIKIVDHLATLDWVLLDAPGDPRVGAIGGSYGGAFQIMGAIFDPRIDAIVPEITWFDITEALAPNGAVKSGWVDLFYVAGNAQQSVVFSDDFHAGFAYATASNEFPAGQYPGVPDLHTRLKEASPVNYPGKLRIPTLLIQGMPDTLFPLNQAADNLRALEAFGVESALYTHLGGHVLQVNSLRADTTPVPVGLQGLAGGKPCGTLTDLQVAWHQKWLLHLPVDTGPRVCLALEDETTVVGETFPLEGTVVQEIALPGPHAVAQAPGGPGLPIDLFTAADETIVAGIPTLTGTITAAGVDSIVYFSLRHAGETDPLEAIVDDQVTPMRISGPITSPQTFTLQLGGVATRLAAGEQLVLMVSTVEPVYFGNAERVPGAVAFGDLKVGLPTLPADTPGLVLP